MMTTRGSIPALALLLCLPAAAPSQTPPPRAHRLAFAPPTGTTLIYSLTSRLSSEGKSFLGESLTLGTQAAGELDLFVRQKSAGNVFVDLSSPGIRVSLQVLDRQDDFTLEAPADDPVQMVLDPACRVLSVGNAEKLEERNPMNFSVLDLLRNSLPALPDRPVSTGDTWQDHKRLQIPFQGMRLLIEIETTYELRDVSPTPDGDLALVATNYSVRLSGSREVENVSGSFEGRGTGTGILNFLIDKGYFSDYRLDYDIDGNMVVGRGETRLAEWPFRLTQSAALTLVEWRQAGP